ncbi:serine hydrolase domain-containing protein [Anaerosacchariphilus polymeriproducens]|uniref:Class C beta-lactamase-related serine hydrolase n=1 Tax=Anaerosacchariphilus polymeriproducens TaxID=1812858 RepID=A0A371AZC0_9FIRM|nr:serine hydrolase [Anaerosacchariphilus polymeriproducens]RDU24907.1 class C beta-lactamase-related serine hydrolase [Anaerosacchariphilus polymeriproducens]
MTLKTQMEKIINRSYNNIGGIIVLKNGKTVYEKYFNECTAASSFHVFSVTKSIISILIGIAIDKGNIKSINQRVLDFFPDYIIKRGEKTIQSVTIKDLLTMTAPYKYKSEPYTEYFASDNWVKSALDLLGGKGKIGEFRYTPLIGPDILSGILVTATGQSVLDFATKYLFSPLEISAKNNVVFQNKEEQFAFYEAKSVSGWAADRTGVNTAGWGLTLTPVEMVKIGQLYLDGGIWKGKQIVSTKWIDESTKEHSRSNQWKLSYGYLWWIIDDKKHVYAAMGDGGNVIYVNEKKKMVVSIASLFMPRAKDRIKLIQEYIVPVFENCVQ